MCPFLQRIQPLGAAAWASAPTPAPTTEHPVSTWLYGLAHVHPHATPPAPFHPKRLCVFTKQTLLLVPARNPEASSYFMYVDRELVNTSGWSSEHIGKQSCSNRPRETHPLSAVVSPGCQPAVSKTGLCQTTISSNNPGSRTITPVMIIPKCSGLNNWLPLIFVSPPATQDQTKKKNNQICTLPNHKGCPTS